MATDNIARGLSKRNEKVLEKQAQEIVDKAVDIKLNTIETSNRAEKLNQAEDGFINVERIKGETVQNLLDSTRIPRKFDVLGSPRTIGRVSMFKPNTVYTIIFYQHSHSNKGTTIINLASGMSKPDIHLPSTLGLNKRTFSFPTEQYHPDRLAQIYFFRSEYDNGARATISDLMILEGDWTNKEIPKYFEGIKSIGEEESLRNLMGRGFADNNLWLRNSHVYLSDGYAKIPMKVDATIKPSALGLKPSTDYTVILDIRKNTYDAPFLVVSKSKKDSDYLTPLPESISIPKGQTGIVKKKITTLSDFTGVTHDLWIFTGAVSSGEVELRMMILEGDWTYRDAPSYFEGDLLSGEENNLKVKTTGKNIVNVRDFISGVSDLGVIGIVPKVTIGNTLRLTLPSDKVIPFPPNTEITCSCSTLQFAIGEMTFDKSSLGDSSWRSNRYTLKTKSDTRYISFNVAKYDNSTITVDDIINSDFMLEVGSTSTSYEPYKEPNTFDIKLEQPLRSLPNGVCDEIIGDKLIRRVGKFVLNGSENWSPNGSNQGYGVVIRGIGGEDKGTVVGNFIVDKLRGCPQDNIYSGTDKNMFAIRGGDTQKAYIRLDETYTTPDSLKKWLSLNPVTFYCELATPITTTISLPSLKSFNNGAIYLQNSITPNVTIKYPTNLAGRVFMAEQEYSRASTSVDNYWQTLLILADRELRMKSIQPLTTNTTADIKNKLNEIMNAWK